MRVRDHVALSAAGAGLLGPWLGRDAVAVWAAGVLIDADHYAWFCMRRHSLDPVAAVRFFNQAHVPQGPRARLLHRGAALVPTAVLGLANRRFRAIALGMGLHVALDAYHERRMDRARAAALHRDEFACRRCGARAPDVGTHLWRQPWLLPSYEPENLVALCGPCHEAAHTNGNASWR